MNLPDRDLLERALNDAGNAHHDYQSNALGGEFDQQWPGWYAAYVLGRIGDFTTPSQLAVLLEAAPEIDNWSSTSATHVLDQLESKSE